MSKVLKEIPEITVESIARTFYQEALGYGFKQVDFLRFVNLLLDYSMSKNGALASSAQANDARLNEIRHSLTAGHDIRLPLFGDDIKIRKLKLPEDSALFDIWLNDQFGRHFLMPGHTPANTDFDETVKNKCNIIGIITLNDSTPIGAVAFLNYDSTQKKAELRKLIGEPSMRGKGFAKEATILWIRYGVSSLGIKKIYLNTLNTHIRNIKLNEDLGFSVEGILRNEAFFDGKYHDLLRMSLCV